MKKLWFFAIALIISKEIYSLPIGNPWEASFYRNGLFFENCIDSIDDCPNWSDSISYRLGFYGYFVFDRHMEIDTSFSHATVHQTEIYTKAGYFVANFWDKIDLFTTLGATKIKYKSAEKTFGGRARTNDFAYLETGNDFSWSIGARATLWEWNCFAIGAEAQYFQAYPDITSTRTEGSDILYPVDYQLKYREYQLGLGCSYWIELNGPESVFIPYAGIKFSRATMSANNLQSYDETFFDMKNEREFGYAFGLTFLACNAFSVTTELDLDEEAFYINSQFRF